MPAPRKAFHPSAPVDLAARLEAKAQTQESERFGAAIGSLVRAVDIWERQGAGLEEFAPPPSWVIEARDQVLAIMEARYG